MSGDICARLRAQQAAVNDQITRTENALPASLTPAQRAQYITQLEGIRAQTNATFAAALAAAGCPPTAP